MSLSIPDRLAEIRRRIESAAARGNRDSDSVILVAVGKTFSASEVSAAVAAGATDLGETKVQEVAAKQPDVPEATWHMIGPLQRNKAKQALQIFDVIHTMDRPELARRLQFLLTENWPGRTQRVLIEVNLGCEPQKAGVVPDAASELLATVLACDRLQAIGLMAIPPHDTNPEVSRPYFRALRELRDSLQDRFGVPLPHLSMGMSNDFEIAIEEGATMVRIGTAIFGTRK